MNPASGETLRVEGVPWWVVVGGLGALIAYPLVFTMPFHQHIVIMALLYGTLGTAWNILGGYTGQVSIGHGVYYGIGAYTAAYFYVNFGLSKARSMRYGTFNSTKANCLITMAF